jgi:hypothetical protein
VTSKQQISDWFDEGVKNNATHMIIVCDTYEHDDYPVWASAMTQQPTSTMDLRFRTDGPGLEWVCKACESGRYAHGPWLHESAWEHHRDRCAFLARQSTERVAP